MLAIEPAELGHQLNNVAWDNINKGEYSTAVDFFEMEISLLDAIGQTGDDNYLSILPCEITCLEGLRNYDLAIRHSDYYLELVNLYKGNNSIEYSHALQTKAGVENEFGNGSEAVKLYTDVRI